MVAAQLPPRQCSSVCYPGRGSVSEGRELLSLEATVPRISPCPGCAVSEHRGEYSSTQHSCYLETGSGNAQAAETNVSQATLVSKDLIGSAREIQTEMFIWFLSSLMSLVFRINPSYSEGELISA